MISLADISQELISEHQGKKYWQKLEVLPRSLLRLRQVIYRPRLIISVGGPTPDVLQRWISEGSNHLIIEPHSSAEVRIGPYVIPGKSPCYRCLQISSEEKLSSVERKEVGSALALATAAITCPEVISLASSGISHFLGKSLIYSNSNFHNPKLEKWSINPGCGCNWR
ncbi:hypothetical protein EMGBS5_10970 [Clavibacter sp.]|nr:hypothetical protein EMGBS5_10970 [Clavibacter sp.]